MFEKSEESGLTGLNPIVVYAVCAVLGLVQLVLGGHVCVFGVSPDFLLALTAVLAFVYGPRVGCVGGFACGLVYDLLGTGPVGLSPLLGCVAGYALGATSQRLLGEGWRAPLARFAVAALLYNAAYPLLLAAIDAGVSYEWAMLGKIAAATALDVAVAALALVPIARTADRRTGSGGLRLL